MAERIRRSPQSDGQLDGPTVNPPERPVTLISPEKAPTEMLKDVLARDGELVAQTSRGAIGVRLYAFPALEGEAQTPFLQSVLDQSSKKPTEIQIAIEPTAEDEYPHAVLQAGTRYGVIVTAPTGLVNQDWGEEKERPVPGFNPLSQATVTKDNIKYDLSEVYKQRKSLAVAVRLRNGYPLAVKQIGRSSSGEIISREALIRGFRHSKKEKGVSYTGATQRVTQALGGGMISPGFGQKGEVEAITEDLIFTPAVG